MAVGVTDDQQKRALLLYQAGAETQEIFEAIPEAGNDYASAMKKQDDYFTPKKNIDYEVGTRVNDYSKLQIKKPKTICVTRR